jgi:hypothetical protein
MKTLPAASKVLTWVWAMMSNEGLVTKIYQHYSKTMLWATVNKVSLYAGNIN